MKKTITLDRRQKMKTKALMIVLLATVLGLSFFVTQAPADSPRARVAVGSAPLPTADVGHNNRITTADKRKGKSLTLTPQGGPIEKVARGPKQESDHPDQPKEPITLETAPKPGDNILTEVLVVRDIYRDYKDCKLVIELANEGTNEIPHEIYKDIELAISRHTPSSGKLTETFCLA